MRVGTAVDTVGQAGRPKTITGFQTHQTPVLLGVRDRAELADADTYEPLTSVLEGVVILRKKNSGDEGQQQATAAFIQAQNLSPELAAKLRAAARK